MLAHSSPNQNYTRTRRRRAAAVLPGETLVRRGFDRLLRRAGARHEPPPTRRWRARTTQGLMQGLTQGHRRMATRRAGLPPTPWLGNTQYVSMVAWCAYRPQSALPDRRRSRPLYKSWAVACDDSAYTVVLSRDAMASIAIWRMCYACVSSCVAVDRERSPDRPLLVRAHVRYGTDRRGIQKHKM